jgi:murein DD-endopeptidase MepM/ murein hydrolase activator NlpD
MKEYGFKFSAVLLALLFLVASLSYAQDDVIPDDPNVVIHVVQRGENLFRIALNYGLTTTQVAQANGITNLGNIAVGQRLIIPLNGIIPQPEVADRIHTVQPGENLQSIANAYGISLDAVIGANQLANPNQLAIGQQITIPTADTAPVAQEAPDLGLVYVVQRGDTLNDIAQRYGVTVAQIQEENDLIGTRIDVGQELAIPQAEVISPDDTSTLPAFITDFALDPLTLRAGKTSRLHISTQSPATITGQFLEREVRFFDLEGGLIQVAFLPVDVLQPSGIYMMTITINQNDGQSVVIPLNIQVTDGNYGSQQISIPADRAELLAPGVEQNELSILRNVTSGTTADRYYNGTMSLPAAAAMNAPFGTLRSYNGGAFDRYHSGTDFAAAPGAPILAAAPGRVVLADTLNIRGISVIIDHGWGVYTNYSHMTERLVNIGDFVQGGQIIGTVGNTGRATGAHLHWELWVNGVAVDPMQWVTESFP